ncbi:MAG: hypothetical protein ACRED8_04995, partial [Caulobacteraceae bacterium]
MGSFRPEEIYEAAFDDEAFARLPQVLAQAANAKSGLVVWRPRDGRSEMASFYNFSPEIVENLPDFLPDDLWS